jgi:hypothetical protein
MTLLIGANLDHYTIVAADTRTSWTDPSLGECHRDGDHKIVWCSLGIITGSGYINALDTVKNELLTKEISHTDQVLQIIKRRALPEIEDLHRRHPDVEDNTCFLLSYRTAINSRIVLRLSIIHPDWNYQLVHWADSIPVMPNDLIGEVEKYAEFLRKNLIKFEGQDPSNKKYTAALFSNLSDNMKIIGTCFHEISKQSSQVSRDLDFAALLLLDGSAIHGHGKADQVMQGYSEMGVWNYQRACVLAPDIIAGSDASVVFP